MKKTLTLFSMLFLLIAGCWSQGFYTSGNQLRDANGNNFIMKGFAVPTAWFVSDVNNNIANMKNNSGANTMRIVCTTGMNENDWKTTVQNCINNKIIPMIELHDVTCINDWNRLNDMAKYWAARASYLTGSGISKYILINIANEWGDGSQSNANWRDAYKTAIATIRNAGINTTLVIDAPGCGQDFNNASTLRTYGWDLINADPKHNLLFSIHMYGVWTPGNNSDPQTGIQLLSASGLPFIVGEFADKGSYGDYDETKVLSTCASVGAGWLAWSWKGNSEPILDMSNNWDGSSLTTWGNNAVWGSNGTKTAVNCSVFGGGCAATPITPNIQVNGGAWVQTGTATIASGTKIILGPQPSTGGSWSWNGGGGTSGTSREQTIYPTGDCDILATYTNSCGSKSTYNFQIRMSGSTSGIVSGGTYSIIAKVSGKALDVTGSGTANGTNVEQWANGGNSNQKWILTDVGSGYYRVSPAHATNMGLDVSGLGTADGTNVQIWTYGGGYNEQFQIASAGNYYTFKDRNSGKYLDVSGGSTADGGNVQIWTYASGSANQQWTLNLLSSPAKVRTNLSDITTESEISIFPNPSNGSFRIENGNSSLFQIFDLNGKLLLSKKLIENTTDINSNLTSGMYMAKITKADKVITIKLIVK